MQDGFWRRNLAWVLKVNQTLSMAGRKMSISGTEEEGEEVTPGRGAGGKRNHRAAPFPSVLHFA